MPRKGAKREATHVIDGHASSPGLADHVGPAQSSDGTAVDSDITMQNVAEPEVEVNVMARRKKSNSKLLGHFASVPRLSIIQSKTLNT